MVNSVRTRRSMHSASQLYSGLDIRACTSDVATTACLFRCLCSGRVPDGRAGESMRRGADLIGAGSSGNETRARLQGNPTTIAPGRKQNPSPLFCSFYSLLHCCCCCVAVLLNYPSCLAQPLFGVRPLRVRVRVRYLLVPLTWPGQTLGQTRQARVRPGQTASSPQLSFMNWMTD